MTDIKQYKTELAAIKSRFQKWLNILEGDRPKEFASTFLSSLTVEQRNELNDKQIKDMDKIKMKQLSTGEELVLLVEQGTSNIVIASHICRERVRRCGENEADGEKWARDTWTTFLNE